MKYKIVALSLLLASQAGAAEIGVASVFYDKVVACPPYRINPYREFGAAHKTLPCGSMVEVTNRINGRRALVPIIDRGPCTTVFCNTKMPKRIRKRIFDMLPPVAKAIGSTGLTPVKLVVLQK